MKTSKKGKYKKKKNPTFCKHRKRGTDQRTRKKKITTEHSQTEECRGWTCQDTQGNRPTEAHSCSGDGRGRDLSGYARKQTDRGALTSWRRQREGLVRTRKETDRPRRTHVLETAEGGTCQDTQGNRPTEAHSQTGDGRGRDLSGYTRKPTDRGALTSWRRQREELVRTRKESC
jgi:hypothetical protein